MKIKNFYIIFFVLIFGKITSQEVSTVVLDSITTHQTSEDNDQIDSVFAAGYETDNAIYPKKYKENFKKKYTSPEFDYTATKPQISLWDRFWQKVEQFFRDIFGQPDPKKAFSYTEAILRFLAIILFGFALYFMINFIFNKNGNFIFGKKNKNITIKNKDLQENIHEINFAETISSLERQKDFRSAIRYQFLQFLKKISDQKTIDWNPEKTNKDYISEIKIPAQKSKFIELAYIYDYVWYGEFSINETDYETFKKKFLS